MDDKGEGPRPKRPRPIGVDDDSDRAPMDKRPRFPKGKKVKRAHGLPAFNGDDGGVAEWMDPQRAAKERAKRRNQMREGELFHDQADTAGTEVNYEDDITFEDDGIQIEPFNLNQEREEGYFDAAGNFVEYASKNEIKDAWLDNLEVDSRLAEKSKMKIIPDEDDQDLSSDDVGKIKRNIANLLQPGETIIHALKRLKGSSSDKRGKMTESTQHTFDQLTEYAVKLMENGEYNVYHEEQETFDREADGYERLTRARGGTLESKDNGSSDARLDRDIFSNGVGNGTDNSSVWDMTPTTTEANVPAAQVSLPDGGDGLDMFGNDDESNPANLQSDGSTIHSGSVTGQVLQPSLENLESSQDMESDYVFDPTSGYYYSSSLGYYYDPTSGFYCCATSGTWYSFDETTGAYTEIKNAASTEHVT